MDAVTSFIQERPFYIAAIVVFVPLAILWNYLRHRKKKTPRPVDAPEPLPVRFGPADYLKAFISWMFLLR